MYPLGDIGNQGDGIMDEFLLNQQRPLLTNLSKSRIIFPKDFERTGVFPSKPDNTLTMNNDLLSRTDYGPQYELGNTTERWAMFDAAAPSPLYGRMYCEETKVTVFNCLLCPYRSNKLSNMKTHIRVHSQEKPFTCKKCGYRATQRSNLKSHVMRHHADDFATLFPDANWPSAKWKQRNCNIRLFTRACARLVEW